MKKHYFRLILKQEQGWFDDNNVYEIATKVQAQLEQIEMGIGDRFGQLIVMITEIISGIIVSFITSWKFTLIFFTSFPLIITGALIMGVCMKNIMVLSRKTYETAGGVAEELLYNIKTVTSFVNFDYEMNRFGNLVDEVEKYERKKSFISGIATGIIVFGIFCGYTFSLLYGRTVIFDNPQVTLIDILNNMYINGFEYNDASNSIKSIFDNNKYKKQNFGVGEIQKILICIVEAIIAIGEISPNIQLIKGACNVSSDYFTLNERIPKIKIDGKNLTPDRNTIYGKIEFKNIKFSYPNDRNKKLILNGLNLIIEPGKKVAFVGESGCGKSTTVNLLERLYEPTYGQILIDGIDIRDYNLEYLRTLIGYVQKEPVLFNKSIKDNLFFGRYEKLKEIDDPEKLMKEACTDAYIYEFINKFPEKYDYKVGVKGNKLSGGQKQRIAIARAILSRPKILILDEATSALDNQSEKEVQSSLDNISKKNVTTLIIAHRLSTIKNADTIFVLKSGQVEEMGTNEELLAKNGFYANLIKTQLGDDQNNARIQKEKTKKLQSIKKLSTNFSKVIENMQKFEKDKIGGEKEEKVEIKKKEIMDLIKDKKLDLILGTIGGFIYGGGTH